MASEYATALARGSQSSTILGLVFSDHQCQILPSHMELRPISQNMGFGGGLEGY